MANFTGFLALPPNKNRGLRFALQSFLPKWEKVCTAQIQYSRFQ